MLDYSIVCENCVHKCNGRLSNIILTEIDDIKIYKCTHFIPIIVFDRKTLQNQVFIEEKQIDRYFDRFTKKRK